jgi:serine/threonine protein phosphatase PrpC
MVPLEEIEKMIKSMDCNQLVQALVDLANQNGGTDNSTAVCLKVS